MIKYALVTAARNEGRYVRNTLETIVAQTVRPVRWVIVSDASTDDTDVVVQEFARKFDFIDFARREDRNVRDFSSQVFAQRLGWERLKDADHEFLGMLDADISLDADYYERILGKFQENVNLGIAGGFIYEQHGAVFRSRKTNSVDSVAGGIQLFRRECFEAIGGYSALKWGGMDTVAEIMARKRGWEVRAFSELKAYHHKAGESWRFGAFRRRVLEGRMDHSLGILPVVEMLKCLRRARVKPYIVGAFFRFGGYLQGVLQREPLVVPEEVADSLRKEHQRRLQLFFGRTLGFNRSSEKTCGRLPEP